MDFKEIALKKVKGEDVSSLTQSFTDEQNIELNKAIVSVSDEMAKESLAKVEALRKEKERIEQSNAAIEKQKEIDTNKFENARSGLKQKARSKLIEKFNPTQEELSSIDAEFLKEDSGSIDLDTVFEDYKKAFVKINPNKFIESFEKQRQNEIEAQNYLASQAGGQNSGGGDGKTEFPPEVLKVVAEAKKAGITMTPQEVQKGMKVGNGWVRTEKN